MFPTTSAFGKATVGRIASAGLIASAWLPVAAAPGHAAFPDQPVQATFQQLPLRMLAERLQLATGVPVVVDRRLNPTQRVSLDCGGEPLTVAAAALAAKIDAEVAELEASVWLVPRGEAGRFTAADAERRQTVRRLPPGTRRRLERTASWSWPAGATPVDLLRELAAANTTGVRLRVAEMSGKIPHDHLAAASLPPLSLAERFDLIAMQYGLRVVWKPPAAGRVEGELSPLPPPGTTVAGTENSPSRPRRPGSRPPATGSSRFTLRVAAPFSELLTAVAQQLKLTPAIDREALRRQGIDPLEIIRLEVADVDRDGLLDAIVAPLGLSWRIDGTTLTVTAAADATP